MDILNVIGSIASVLSLLVSVFVANRVVKIGNSVVIKGKGNFAVGGDAKM